MALDLLFRDSLDLLFLGYEFCEERSKHAAVLVYSFDGDWSDVVAAVGLLVGLSELVSSVKGEALHCLWCLLIVPAQRG